MNWLRPNMLKYAYYFFKTELSCIFDTTKDQGNTFWIATKVYRDKQLDEDNDKEAQMSKIRTS